MGIGVIRQTKDKLLSFLINPSPFKNPLTPSCPRGDVGSKGDCSIWSARLCGSMILSEAFASAAHIEENEINRTFLRFRKDPR